MAAATEVWKAIQRAMAADLPASGAAATLAAAALCKRLPAQCHQIAAQVATSARARLVESKCVTMARNYASHHVAAAALLTDTGSIIGADSLCAVTAGVRLADGLQLSPWDAVQLLCMARTGMPRPLSWRSLETWPSMRRQHKSRVLALRRWELFLQALQVRI